MITWHVQEQYQKNVSNLTSEIEDLSTQKSDLENKIKELEKGKNQVKNNHEPELQKQSPRKKRKKT